MLDQFQLAVIILMFLALTIEIIIVSLIYFIIWRRQRRQKKWLKKFAPTREEIKQCIVCYIPRPWINQRQTKAERKVGILQYGEGQASYLIPDDRDSRVVTWDFDRNSQLALLTAQSFLTSKTGEQYIRFINSQENKSYYFVATNLKGIPDAIETRKVFDELAPQFNSCIISYGKKPPRWLKLLLISALVAIICFVGRMILSGLQLENLEGPRFIAVAPSGEVFAANHNDLYSLDSQGNLQKKYSLQALGIQEGITDIYAIDCKQIMLGDWGNGTIQLCQLDRETCNPLPAFQDSQKNMKFRSAFKFVLDRQNNLIYATDTGRHRLVVLTRDGELVESTRGEEMLLCYPNGIAIGPQGKLAVADSNNFRVITWSSNSQGLELVPDRQIDSIQPPRPLTRCTPDNQPRAQNQIARIFRAISGVLLQYEQKGKAIALAVADKGRVFPTFVEQDDRGFWWVLVGDGNFSRDNLLRFDANWENPQKINLPNRKDISNIAVGENQVLLTVPERYQIWSVSIQYLSVNLFGKERFGVLMNNAQKSKVNLRLFYDLGLMIAIAVTLFLLALASSWEQRQKLIELLNLDPTIPNN